VLATGSSYPFPAKMHVDDRAGATAALGATRGELAGAGRVLLLGAGPVGLELAGEIKAAWPDKAVTIVDPADDILSGGYPDEFRAELRGQLAELGVELVLGTSLAEPPPSEPGEAKTFTVTTHSGVEIAADIWFRCFGVAPVSDYLAGDLASARRPNGHVEVTDHLLLPGQDRVFAIGDMTALPEPKMSYIAGKHAELVIGNIRALLAGGEPAKYQPAPPAISVPLGPTGGATYTAEVGILDAQTTSQLKGGDLRIGRLVKLFGLE
jgi:apoptosis-inducing factor 2